MAKVGDRVLVEGLKVGGAKREGTPLSVAGSLIRVRWADGAETMFIPGPGTVLPSAAAPGSTYQTLRASLRGQQRARSAAERLP